MSWASPAYERAALEWDQTGRPELQPDPWSVMVLGCWLASIGATHDGVSEALRAYHAAQRRTLDRRQPDWLDGLLGDREHCSFCGESWRTENCSLCTTCARAMPPCCGERRGIVVLENGNRQCPICRRGELVG